MDGVVDVPREIWPIVGSPDEGTRMYRREAASEEEIGDWHDLLNKLYGSMVSPGGVSMYCPVSRAAVNKRIRDGKMTIFLFHVTRRKTNLFGKEHLLRSSPYGYIPVSEAKAWRRELEDRALRQGTITREELENARPEWKKKLEEQLWKNSGITREELEGTKPDLRSEFLEWKNEKERDNGLDSYGMTKMDLIKALGQGLWEMGKEGLRKRNLF